MGCPFLSVTIELSILRLYLPLARVFDWFCRVRAGSTLAAVSVPFYPLPFTFFFSLRVPVSCFLELLSWFLGKRVSEALAALLD